ncbi:MAG: SRPBCC family protein, partial [bacterium]
TYDLAGQLVLAPEFDLETLPQTCAALPQYEISEAAHFAFVRQTAGVVPLNDYCGEMADELDAYGIAGLKFERRMSYDLACNWKVYVENYLEPYHLPLVHPALHRVTDYDRYAIDCRGWHVRQQGPPRDAKAPTAGWYWLFPNTIVNCSFGLVSTNMVLPVDAGHCRVIADFYVRESADSAVTDEAIAFSDAIQVEDVAICEAVQQGLASGAYAYGVLHPTREIGLMHFAMLYRRMMGQG